jgi:transposase
MDNPYLDTYLAQIEADREDIFRRDQKIVAAWESGQKYSEIARAFDLSKGNVKDRIERFYRTKRNHESTNPFDKISQRTQNIFQKVGISTVEQVVDRYNRNELLCIDNFGRMGLREIETWFPVPVPRGSLKRTST